MSASNQFSINSVRRREINLSQKSYQVELRLVSYLAYWFLTRREKYLFVLDHIAWVVLKNCLFATATSV